MTDDRERIDVDRFVRAVAGQYQYMLRCRQCGWESGIFLDCNRCRDAAVAHLENVHAPDSGPVEFRVDPNTVGTTLDEVRQEGHHPWA